MEHLPDYVQFKPCPGTPLKEIFIAASDDLLDILQGMLTMDPLRRLTATQVYIYLFFNLTVHIIQLLSHFISYPWITKNMQESKDVTINVWTNKLCTERYRTSPVGQVTLFP